jgi:hypothetical protein
MENTNHDTVSDVGARAPDTVDASDQDGDAGLTPTRQAPVSAVATIDLADRTVTDVWRALVECDAVRDRFIQAVRAFARDRTPTDLLDALDERDVPIHLRSKILAVARGDRVRAWHLATDAVPSLGSGRSTVEDLFATATLFDALDETPTVAVQVGQDFRERRREQRVDVCRLVATLARGFDVRLVATGLTQAWLAREHREDLPVSEWCNTHRGDSPDADAVEDALATLDPDGRKVSILRWLDDAPGGTLTYHALYARSHVTDKRVIQRLGDLADLGLVERFGPKNDKKVVLLDAGREYLSQIARQSTLSEVESETPQHHTQAVLSRGQDAPPEDAGPYRTEYLPPADHAAAVASGTAGGVSLVSHPDERADTDKIRWVSYDDDRDEAVIDVRASGALQYTVSVATALASPEFVDRALPVDRLESLDDPPAILRDARCIGALSDAALADGQVLRDALVEWGEDLADLTRDLKRGEYDDCADLRSSIMRSAHGLAGSIVHLLDAVGTDLTRVVRVPGGLDSEHLDALARSVGISTAIQSQYGAFAVYRQLFEDREDKRRSAFTPDVDATDPVGELIGSFVFRGPDTHRLEGPLADHVETPRDVVEDAPEFAVRVPIQSVGRPAFATVATRVLSSKDLRRTQEAVSLLHGLTGSPYDVARALQQLSPEDDAREVRPDELRYALATLDPERILPDLPPTAGAIVAALLAVDERVSQTDLADRADVSTESIRRHRDRLADLGLVEWDGTGYRLTLSFRTRAERRAPVLPDTVESRFIQVVDALLVDALPPDRYADPEDPVGGTLFAPQDPWGIPDESPLSPWVSVAGALAGAIRPDREVTVSVGPTIEQTPLTATPEVAHAD